MTTIAWTGHRPGDLPTYVTYFDLQSTLDNEGFIAERNDLHFVTGGALGVDTWAAEYAIQTGIPFTLILPFDLYIMTAHWREHDRQVLARHVNLAQETIILANRYDVRVYQQRNIRMVDLADSIYAVWSGKKFGGTANCIRYALTTGKPIFNLYPFNGNIHPITKENVDAQPHS